VRECWRAPRRLVRHAVTVGLIGVALSLIAALTGRGSSLGAWIQLLGAPLGVAGLIGAYGLSRYSTELAARVGNAFTMRRSRTYFQLYFLGWCLWILGSVLLLARLSFGACFLAPGIAAVLGCGVLTIFLPGYLVGELEQYRLRAEQNWRTALQNNASEADCP
jgi:hypothetical protein